MLDQRVPSMQSGVFNGHRAPLDPCTRKMIFGPVRPMDQPGFFRRLLLGG